MVNLGSILPFYSRIDSSQSVLIAGAGGGFDVFTGLPLYFQLKEMGKDVHIASLSFTELERTDARRLTSCLYEVTAATNGPAYYFPEGYLARWFGQSGDPIPIYCIDRSGVAPITEAYSVLAERTSADAVVLVDGGTDSLMRGDETGLGTPEEDIASIAAVDSLDLPTKLLVCQGFGIDAFHGVCHGQVLQAVAELTRSGAFAGAWSLLPSAPECRLYMEAISYVTEQMPERPSIVNTSIISAVQGLFGDHHATRRTAGSELFINPLMTLYWAFDLAAVARRNLYLEQIRDTATYVELRVAIARFRASLRFTMPWTNIPL